MSFLIAIIAIGCTKAECSKSSDCLSKTCTISTCEKSKCSYTAEPNCCGNGLKESIKNGKPGNKCTCPQDFGKCDGKGKIILGKITKDAVYATYYCDSGNQCVLGVDKNDVNPQNFLDGISIGYFKASSVIKYNKPFDINKDYFEFKISLDDANSDLMLPITITSVKIMYTGQYSGSELLVAEKVLNSTLDNIGSTITISVPLNLDYRPHDIEETGSMRYSFDYTYAKKVQSGKSVNGTISYKQQVIREKFSATSKQLFMVRSG